MRSQRALAALSILASTAVLVTLCVSTAVAFEEHFEGPNTSWQPAGSDAKFRLVAHARTRDDVHADGAAEFVEISAGNGSYFYLAHPIPAARVIGELKASVWLKSNRPGLSFFARVVLPRTRHPRTGQPLTVLLPGKSYGAAGSWQQLSVTSMPEALVRQVRVLRTQFGSEIDSREAYVDQLVINAYGGEGTTQTWLDDLEIVGDVSPRDAPARLAAFEEQVAADAGTWRPAGEAGRTPVDTENSAYITGAQRNAGVRSDYEVASASSAPGVMQAAWEDRAVGLEESTLKFQGTRLMWGGRAILPRIVQHRGEPLESLRQLGFNMVWLDALPHDELLREAAQLGLWLISPPPSLEALANSPISSKYDVVAAWSLGAGLTRADLERTREWADRIHTQDPVSGRILLVGCHDELRAFSRLSDAILIGRNPIGTSLSLDNYGAYLAAQPRFARPGTPLWVRVPTDLEPALTAQWSALFEVLGTGGTTLAGAPSSDAGAAPRVLPPSAGVAPLQLRTLIYASLAAGSRGFLFESHDRLDLNDRETRRRRAMLELINLELVLIEPWAAGGSFVSAAPSGEAELYGVALQTDRARLLLPLRTGPLDQFVPEPLGWAARSFIVPGVPDSNDAYELTPSGVSPLEHRRVTGGIRISQDVYAGGALVVMSNDPRVASGLSRHIAETQRRAAELKRELALLEYQATESIERRLPPAKNVSDVIDLLKTAQGAMDQASVFAGSNDARRAYQKSEEALVILARLQRRRWQAIVEAWPSVIASPLATTYPLLPQQVLLMERLATSQVTLSELAGGEIENLDAMLQAGWRHYSHPQNGISSDVELSPQEPHSGRFSLRLRAWTMDETAAASPVETAPVWVTSAPVNVERGTLIRIRGFARIPAPIEGSGDGLLVIDSLGGLPLAERLYSKGNGEWREFTLFRAAPQSGPLTVTFALSGLGEAWIDDVTVEVVQLAPAAPPRSAQLGDIFGSPLRR